MDTAEKLEQSGLAKQKGTDYFKVSRNLITLKTLGTAPFTVIVCYKLKIFYL